ncbi:MAG: universal stress protein [Nocardioidaceae bacterium]
MPTDHLVIGYEGGSNGHDALRFGERWALASDDRLIVVTVHPGAAAAGIQRVDAEWVAYEREEADRLLQEAEQLLLESLNAEFRRIDASSAAHGLHDIAEEGGTVLVLGARRARGLRRTYPGSTAERLLHGAAIPVAIVPSGYADREGDPLRRVTVAFIDTPDGQAAVDSAVRITKHLKAELTIVSVLPDTRMVPSMGEPRRFFSGQKASFQQSLNAVVEPAREQGPVTGRLLEGPVVDALVEIGPDETDLLIIGSRGYGPVARVLLGGVSSRVVRHARVPVVVVPRPVADG